MKNYAASAAKAKAKWATGLAGASKAYIDGVNATSVDPTALAADAVDNGTWLAGVTAAQARTSAHLRAAGKSSWSNGCIKVGAARLASGVQKGQGKYNAGIDKLVPIWQQMGQAAAAIAGTGLGAAQARSAAALQALFAGVGKS